jgi:hypothetical protein
MWAYARMCRHVEECVRMGAGLDRCWHWPADFGTIEAVEMVQGKRSK